MVPTLAELEELDAEAQELPGVVLDMDNLSRCAPLCAHPLNSLSSATTSRVPHEVLTLMGHVSLNLICCALVWRDVSFAMQMTPSPLRQASVPLTYSWLMW